MLLVFHAQWKWPVPDSCSGHRFWAKTTLGLPVLPDNFEIVKKTKTTVCGLEGVYSSEFTTCVRVVHVNICVYIYIKIYIHLVIVMHRDY